jgi:hypothetical protein
MDEHSAELLSVVCEIRDFIRLMAEPAIAERDQKLRDELRRIIGKSPTKAKAVLLMDGSRLQSAIQRESGMNQGNLSRLVKELSDGNLLSSEGKEPKLAISIPANFFENGATNE